MKKKKQSFNQNEQNNMANNAPADEMIDINSYLPEELVTKSEQDTSQQAPIPNDYDDFITTEVENIDEAPMMNGNPPAENAGFQDSEIQFADEIDIPKTGSKKNVVIASISAVCVVFIAVFCFLFFNGTLDTMFISGGNEEMINAIPAEVEDLTLDDVSEDFQLASGIFVNGQSIGKMNIADARKVLEKYVRENPFQFAYKIEANGNTYTLESEGLELEANIESVLATAAKYTEENDGVLPTDKNGDTQQVEYMIPFALVENNSLTQKLDEAAESLNTEPVNAKVVGFNPGADTEEKFTFEGGTDGQQIDYDEVIKAVNLCLWDQEDDATVEAATNPVAPEITKEMATENMVPISTFTTTSTNTANANHNMATALNACNGSIIEPGEIWSFNDSTGNSNLEENGYVPGTVISGGQYTTGVGGGLCQASSTIYNAALYANLGIVERYNHLWASTYVYSGFDATIDWGNLDLKLQNNTDYSIYLECYMEGTTLTATFYGWKDPSYDGIVTYSYNHAISSSYYGTESFRIYIKDGEEIARETLPSSQYQLDASHSVWTSDSGTLGGIPGEPLQSYEVTKDPNDTGYWSSGWNSGDSSDDDDDDEEYYEDPTEAPTTQPTNPPTEAPTDPPTDPPTEAPTDAPTDPPTEAPTDPPTDPPTEAPTSNTEETAVGSV